MRPFKKYLIVIVASLFSSSDCAQFKEISPTSYLFMPGLTSYEPQLARYLPSFVGITGEKISCSKGIHTVGEKVTTGKFSEIVLKNTKRCFKNPLYFLISFFIGLRDRKFCTSVIRNEESDHTLEAPAINFLTINLGQEKDIEVLQETYNLHLDKYPQHDIVLYGTSRGAVTAFNFMALHTPPYVKAVVLEGMFDDLHHLLKRTCGPFHSIAKFFISRFTAYQFDGITPLKYAEQFPKDIPLLLISSKKDEMVPYFCAHNMYELLKKSGHKKVHFLELKDANHDSYSIHNIEDRKLYEEVVHAFYKHYGLPYDPLLAENGASYWEQMLQQTL